MKATLVRNAFFVGCFILPALISLPAAAETVFEFALREEGRLIPKIQKVNKKSKHRFQTTIRPSSNGQGFMIDFKFDNTHKVENAHLCSGVLILDGQKHVMATAGGRKLVDAVWTGKTQVKRASTQILMSPADTEKAAFAEVWHDRCPDNDFLKRLEDLKRGSALATEVSANAAIFFGGGN